MSMDNIWQRRSNSGKLVLSTDPKNVTKDGFRSEQSRPYQPAKRFGGEGSISNKSNPFNGITPLTTPPVTSPTSSASSAFNLGSGAFASFGSAKTPKTPSTGLDFSSSAATATNTTRNKDIAKENGGQAFKTNTSLTPLKSAPRSASSDHALKCTWIVWYRPPTSKYSDYEKSTIPLAQFGSVEAFWAIYTHLKRPSSLPPVSDYHIFRKGIRPVWEDEENKRGGKWIVRLKKGVCDRFWEDLLFAIVGDQFAEASEEVCGAVLSIRSGEDVLSVWTRIDGGRNIKIRETVKRLLAFPTDTNIVWKSHDDSIAQRSAIDQARHEKNLGNGPNHGQSRRRETLSEDPIPENSANLGA